MSFNQCYRCVLRLTIIPLLISTFLLHSNLINVSYAQITLDGSMGPGGPLTGPDYDITSNLGQIRGSNLFHSFGEFNVLTGESATFSGPGSIANILNRVTGGNQSFIDGLLRSTIPGANLYLLNPAGVLFGANASLDVSGSFHVSTADYLRFNDETVFHADLSKTSTLTVAEPAAFGFLSNNPAAISIDQSSLQVPAGETLSVIGGDIDIMGSVSNDNLIAPGGRINITSVASPGEVIPNAPGDAPDLQVDAFSSLGTINLSQDAVVQAGGDGGGTVIIRGGRLMMDNADISASTRGPAVGPLVGVPGAGIDIQVTEDVVLDNGSDIETNVFPNVASGIGSGGIRVKADSLEVANFSALRSIVFWQSTGSNAGDIVVDANSVLIRDQGSIGSSTGGVGGGPNITVNTDSLEVRDGGQIFATAFAGTGNAGNINIDAKSILLSDNKPGGLFTMITAQTWGGTGNAGDMRINTDSLNIFGNGTDEMAISNITWAAGQGGKTDITVNGNISISGSNDISIPVGIFTNTWGSGTGGGLSLTSNGLTLTNAGSIQTSSYWTGRGGNLQLTTSDLKLTNRGFIGASAFSLGDAGDTTIRTGSLEIRDGSLITTSALFGFGGNAGNLEVVADSVLISGLKNSPDPFGADFTGITTESGRIGGRGGDFNLTANSLVMTQRGSISSSSFGPDRGGDIVLNVGNLQVLDGSNIVAGAFEAGDGGNINVIADSVLISGINSESYTDINGNTVLSHSGIASEAKNSGNAGDVQITIDTLDVLDGGIISTSTFGSGIGGDIAISTGQDVLLRNGALVSAESFGLGDAGNVTIDVGNTFQSESSTVKTSAEVAEGGDITITAGQDVLLHNGTVVSAESSGPGNAGKITINASNSVSLLNTSLIKSNTVDGQGGSIQINVPDLSLSGGSIMSASSFGDGQGGSINLNVTDLSLDGGSNLETAGTGAGDAGSVTVNAANSVSLLNSSGIFGETNGSGKGGSVNINAVDLTFDNDSGIQVSSFGSGEAGSIEIKTKNSVSISGESYISSETRGTGNAGTIELDVGNLTLTNLGWISTSSEGSSGNAGNITIKTTDSFNMSGESFVASSTSGEGDGGIVTIMAGDTFQSDNSAVLTSAEKAEGGDITITAGQNVLLRNGSLISAESSGAGNSGNININAGNTYLSENSSVTTVSKQADGGNIELTAQYMVHMINSEISSSVNGGSDTVGGNITIVDPQYVILQNSHIVANAFEGKGGNISITAGVFLADPNSIVSASSARGVDGEVDIRAPVTNISGNIAPLQNNYLSAASLLHNPCVVKLSDGEYSSLIVQGDDGLPIGPGDLLPSPLYVGEMVESDVRVASLLDKEPLSYGINVFEEKGLLPLAMLNDDTGCSSCPE